MGPRAQGTAGPTIGPVCGPGIGPFECISQDLLRRRRYLLTPQRQALTEAAQPVHCVKRPAGCAGRSEDNRGKGVGGAALVQPGGPPPPQPKLEATNVTQPRRKD
jgi:hypothetical protein